ncbi:MAG TPA: efflux RND transporter periplasmic adaptor subunit [Bryobacteraceae bacterium]|nr:efflux RND transporter periplasmic adaptor subunit [Bryobacteraceae bacterium]
MYQAIDRFRTPLLTLTLLTVLVGLIGCAAKPTANSGARPPATVGVVTVKQERVPIYGNWVTTLDGFVNANIQPQVSGYLIRQDYREGSLVKKDQVLFEIDPRPFQAVLDQAKGQLAQARGQLGQAQAQLGLAQINVKRDTPLAKARAIAQSQLDNDVQTEKQNEAQILSSEASIEAAQANVESASINLGFTKVRSLVDGIAGQATTQIGNLVSPSTVLTAVSQVNPIKAYFPMTEQEYLRIADKIKPGDDLLRSKNPVPLDLTLANNSTYPFRGKILFADRQIDTQTGTIRIVAAFSNPNNILRPGQYGRIRAMTAIQDNALVVPQRAVTELQGRYQIAVVGADNKVNIRTVEVGSQVAQMWIINKGVQVGDRIVSEGTSKVQDGATVNPTPDDTAVESTSASAGGGTSN